MFHGKGNNRDNMKSVIADHIKVLIPSNNLRFMLNAKV